MFWKSNLPMDSPCGAFSCCQGQRRDNDCLRHCTVSDRVSRFRTHLLALSLLTCATQNDLAWWASPFCDCSVWLACQPGSNLYPKATRTFWAPIGQESGFISECRHLWVRFRVNPTSLIWPEQCTHSNTLVTEVLTI